MNYLIVIPILMMTTLTSNAAIGCLDDSYHAQRSEFYHNLDPSLKNVLLPYRNEDDYPIDSKRWHPVACSCPCELYRGYYLKQSTQPYGFCAMCRHRGYPQRSSTQHTHDDTHTLAKQFALFKKVQAKS